jgi:hypothetical protein
MRRQHKRTARQYKEVLLHQPWDLL